jgi:hypothetical protein
MAGSVPFNVNSNGRRKSGGDQAPCRFCGGGSPLGERVTGPLFANDAADDRACGIDCTISVSASADPSRDRPGR